MLSIVGREDLCANFGVRIPLPGNHPASSLIAIALPQVGETADVNPQTEE